MDSSIVIVVVVVIALAVPVVGVLLFVRWFDRARARPPRDGVAGTLRVERVSSATQGDFIPNAGDLLPVHEDFVVEGMLTGPTLAAPLRVAVRAADWTTAWPQPGHDIPVVYDRDDPTRIELAARG